MKNPIHMIQDMTPTARLTAVLARLAELGYTVEIGDHPSRSMTNPFTRTIKLQAGTDVGISFLPLLAHELAHAESQGRGLAGRLWFAMAYAGGGIVGAVMALYALVGAFWNPALLLLLPLAIALAHWSDRWRANEEIEGEAHEAAMRARLRSEEKPRASHRLGGFRPPYLIFGAPAGFSALIERRAFEILSV